jgi:hypothetical protein
MTVTTDVPLLDFSYVFAFFAKVGDAIFVVIDRCNTVLGFKNPLYIDFVIRQTSKWFAVDRDDIVIVRRTVPMPCIPFVTFPMSAYFRS